MLAPRGFQQLVAVISETGEAVTFPPAGDLPATLVDR